MPTAYFTIIDIENNKIIKFEDYLKLLELSLKLNDEYKKSFNLISGGYEISKTVKNK
jgi:hypothetical protein